MRIAIATRHRERVGGIESYLETLLPSLARRGHELFFLSEGRASSRPIAVPDGATIDTLSDTGCDASVAAVNAWRPDVVFLHGLSDARVEAALLALAPGVLFLHAYHGTCVSGTKTHAFPGVTPCARVLGPGCLAQYFPRRCGGLSPVTMLRRYQVESAHRSLFARYRQVVVLSDHMKHEAVRHGVAAERVALLPPPIDGPAAAAMSPARRARLMARDGGPLRLLFIGRHEMEKGGQVLIDALPAIAAAIPDNVEVVFAGDGRLRHDWEARAARHVTDRIGVKFVGQVEPAARDTWFDWADLLVVPSLWPEPFGLVGAEAAVHGLPAAAFDNGGTRQWLADGRSGRLAAAGRLDAAALADAITWCARDRRLPSLVEGAIAQASTWSMARHVVELEEALTRAVQRQA